MTNKIIYGGIVIGAVLGALAFFGFTPFGKQVIQQFGSPAGTTLSTAKFAGAVISLATPSTTGTSTTLTNGDASARYITGVRIGCTNLGTSKSAYVGNGLDALKVSVATTTTANPANPTYNFAVLLNAAIATSSPNFTLASSTQNVANSTSTNAMYWGAGEFLTFWWNATNTAACTVGVDYIAS